MLNRITITAIASLAGAALVGLLALGVFALGSNHTLDEALAAHRQPLAPGINTRLARLGRPGFGSINEYRGHVVLLNFWASWCPPCRSEAPLMASAQRQLTAYGATVLGISYKDTRSDSEAFMREHHLDYPDLRDDGVLAESYGTSALPESFLINRSGHIVRLARGEIEAGFVQQALALARSERKQARTR